jgi:DNA polymerase I-like protein with 3'-5' exonuclease and polymerase domains
MTIKLTVTDLHRILKNQKQDQADFHRACAAEMYGIPYEEVTNEQCKEAKSSNFLLLYSQAFHTKTG